MKKPLWFENLLNFLAGDFFETYAVAYFLAVVPFMYLSLFYTPPQKPGGIFNATFLLVILSGIFLLPALGIALRFTPFSFIHFLKLIGVVITGGLLGPAIFQIGGPIGSISFLLGTATIFGVPEIISYIVYIPLALLFLFLTFISLLSIGSGITALIKGIFRLKFSNKWQLSIGSAIGLLILVGLIIYLTISKRFVNDHDRPMFFLIGFLGWSHGAALGAALFDSWAAIRESRKLSKAT